MIDVTYDLNFIRESSIPFAEKYKAIDEVMHLVREYERWRMWKEIGGIEQRKKVIRGTKRQQQKRLDNLRSTLDLLTQDDMEVSTTTLQELLDIYIKLQDEDIIGKVEDNFDGELPKKPNTTAIVAKLEEIHDKYDLPKTTDNIRIFLEQLS